MSKDNRGSSTGYKLIATTTFNIIYEDNEKKFPFQKICHLVNLKMFLRKSYESKIKNNIAQLIVEKLIRNLSAMK